ncbi:MAG: L-Ala-D/L-Glu epimerase [Alphaproteobacteria bacterium]
MPEMQAVHEVFPIRGTFTISRGSKTEAHVVVVTLRDGDTVGRGECLPYPRYDETIASVMTELEAARAAIEAGIDREGLLQYMPAGAARNAVDCALWDLEAKQTGKRAWELAGLPEPYGVTTAYTLSLAPPARMAEAARESADKALLKLKLAGDDLDVERVAAVRQAAPQAALIVDANEGWAAADTADLLKEMARLGVALVEQPLPADDDAALADIERAVPVCADESCHTRDKLDLLVARYDAINIKLDKTGGLTEALALARAARESGLTRMVGCMLATSLSMAPALLLAPGAAFVDLDGPLLLARDRAAGLSYQGSLIGSLEPELWG